MKNLDIRNFAAKQAGIKSAQGKIFLDAYLKGIKSTVVDKKLKVTVRGFGVFKPRFITAHVGYNPSTGGKLNIGAGVALAFKPSKKK